MRSYFLILFFLILIAFANKAFAEQEFYLCPLCNGDKVTCPKGFEAACADLVPGETVPKCIFFENKYIPGCWKFVGKKKLDLSLIPANMPPSTMIKVIGGGEIYTLNREIIGCKKL